MLSKVMTVRGNINIHLGDEAFGGKVFYIDETEQRGFVVSLENMTYQGANSFGGICDGNFIGANSAQIGFGYQNTLAINSLVSSDANWSVSNAAHITSIYEGEGYTDWFLPSNEELLILNSANQNLDLGLDISGGYISSTEFLRNDIESDSILFNNAIQAHGGDWIIDCSACYLNISTGEIEIIDAASYTSVRAIRSFGNWTLGCMDSLACNYNPEANMADGSCEYTQQGYDCDGNELSQYQVGDLAEGGIVFLYRRIW